MTNGNTKSKARLRSGNILIYFLGIVLIGSSIAKFAQVPQVVSQLGALGFAGNRLMVIAVLEMMSAILFLVARTRAVGLLLVSAYLGGAIATHVGHAQSPMQPAFVLALFWLGAWLHHPEILWSLATPESAGRSVTYGSK